MTVTGDIHNIAQEVQKFDPNYFLKLNTASGVYQVVERRPRKKKEGRLDGVPLFSYVEVEEVVMTIDFIDATTQAPDMRIVHALREKDVWNYPGGPKAYYDDMMRDSEKRREKRNADIAQRERDMLEERHKYIVREHDGMSGLQTVF